MNIVDFIKARLDDDERIAQAAFLATMPGTESWTVVAMQVWSEHDPKTLVVNHTWPKEGEHIARHDPARVLRQCAALRETIRLVDELAFDANGNGSELTLWNYLSPLASIWSDHPDYQQDWSDD